MRLALGAVGPRERRQRPDRPYGGDVLPQPDDRLGQDAALGEQGLETAGTAALGMGGDDGGDVLERLRLDSARGQRLSSRADVAERAQANHAAQRDGRLRHVVANGLQGRGDELDPRDVPAGGDEPQDGDDVADDR